MNAVSAASRISSRSSLLSSVVRRENTEKSGNPISRITASIVNQILITQLLEPLQEQPRLLPQLSLHGYDELFS